MVERQSCVKGYKYFSPPRWSVFQTELPARDADSQKSGRKRRFFQSVSERQLDTSHVKFPGGTGAKSTLSTGNQKASDQNVTFEISRSTKDQKVFGKSTVSSESQTHNQSFLDEHEMESTFCLPQAEDFTFTVPANKEKNNSSVKKTQTMKMHAMITRQSGKYALQNSSTIGMLDGTFTMASGSSGLVLDSTFDCSATKPLKQEVASQDSQVLKGMSDGTFTMASGSLGLVLYSTFDCSATKQLKQEVASQDAQVLKGARSRRFFPSPEAKGDTKVHSVISDVNETRPAFTTDALTVELPSYGNVLPKMKSHGLYHQQLSTSSNSAIHAVSICNPGVRRSLRIKSEQTTQPLSAIVESPPSNIQKTKSPSRLVRVDLTKSQLSSSCLSSVTASSAVSGFPDLPMNCFTPSASSSPTRKRTSGGGLDDTFTLTHGNVSQLLSKDNVLGRNKEVLLSASKGKAESSLMLATCNSTFELPSHVIGSFIKTETNTEPEDENNTAYLQSNHTSYRYDMPDEQRNITIKTEKSSPTFSATESSKNEAERVRRVAQRRAKTNKSDLQLQPSDLTQAEASIRALSGIGETTSVCVPELPSYFVPSVGTVYKEEPTDVPEALPAYFSQAVNMADDKENVPEKFGIVPTKEANHQLQRSFKSRIPVPTKQLVCREKFVSKIPTSFKFRKAGPGSSTRTATAKQRSADKIIPFQFSAKPATVTNKPTVQVGALASHREKAAAQRRMTARSVASKSAPNDRIGKKVKQQKFYHEMVRTNRTHELMLRRKM